MLVPSPMEVDEQGQVESRSLQLVESDRETHRQTDRVAVAWSAVLHCYFLSPIQCRLAGVLHAWLMCVAGPVKGLRAATGATSAHRPNLSTYPTALPRNPAQTAFAPQPVSKSWPGDLGFFHAAINRPLCSGPGRGREGYSKTAQKPIEKKMDLNLVADLAGQTALVLLVVWFIVLVITRVRHQLSRRDPSKTGSTEQLRQGQQVTSTDAS
jgi:hypothetical protein